MPRSRANEIACSISVSSWVATAVKPSAGERGLQQPDVRRVDVALLRIGDLRRLEVRALDEAKVRRERQQRGEVGLAAEEVRLEDGADVVVAARRAGGGRCGASASTWRRLLHVDADEVARRCAACSTSSATFRVRELLVDREAEVRELERDVRPQPLGVRCGRAARGRRRRRRGVSASSRTPSPRSVVFVSRPLLVQPPQDGDRRVEAFAGDEARGAEPEAVPLHEPLQARAVRGREEQAADGAQPASPRRSARPRRAPPPSGRAAARSPRARPGRRASRAPSSTPRGRGSAAARRRSAVAFSRASGRPVADERDDRVGEAPGEPRDRHRRRRRRGPARAAPRRRRRRRAPRRGTARAAPTGLSETFIPARFGRALAQPLDHRERDRVAAPRLELVEVERHRARTRAPPPSKCASSSCSSSAK